MSTGATLFLIVLLAIAGGAMHLVATRDARAERAKREADERERARRRARVRVTDE